MPYMSWTLENCKISQYQSSADRFDFQPQLTTEPTAPEAGGKGYVLTSIQHSATDTSLLDQPNTEASSRLFVGNLTMNSEASLGDPITFTATVRVNPPAYDDPQLIAVHTRTGLLLPAVQDDGLLLPAVQDDGEASIKDGTSNTVMIGEVVPTGRTDGDSDGDTFEFTTEPTAPEPYLGVKLENAIITSYSVGRSPLVGDGDSFGFGVEPEMKEFWREGWYRRLAHRRPHRLRAVGDRLPWLRWRSSRRFRRCEWRRRQT